MEADTEHRRASIVELVLKLFTFFFFFKEQYREFPGSPVVKTLS